MNEYVCHLSYPPAFMTAPMLAYSSCGDEVRVLTLAQVSVHSMHTLPLILIHVGDPCVLKRAKTPAHYITIDPRYSSRFDDSVFFMVAELVIWNNDVFTGKFPGSPREKET